MKKSYSDSYKKAGVDIEEGYRAVELMKRHIAKTSIEGAGQDIGGFGGIFVPDLTGIAEPVLVSGTDGVGTKLKIAFLLDRHDTIGIDCVAMCVNDIVCSGAKPLFFLDYIALGKSVAEKVADIVSGVAEGCVQAGCALIGGETAEMPGFYRDGEYDVAGFAVGLADRSRMPDKTRVRAGDTIVGLPSSGLHSNGYSLVRSVLDVERADLLSPVAELGGCSLGDALLAPTRIYVKPILALLQKVDIHSIAHITGGGFYENIPRSLPSGAGARIERKTFDVPQIFEMIQRIGDIPQRDMFNTFNMGIGMTVVVRPDQADEAVRILRKEGVEAVCIGEVAEGDGGVELC